MLDWEIIWGSESFRMSDKLFKLMVKQVKLQPETHRAICLMGFYHNLHLVVLVYFIYEL